jgi:phosphatidylglycerol:prolipoprotein diacylglycerol transferase
MIPFPNISPEIVSIGPVAIRWYGMMYVVAFAVGYKLLERRRNRGLFQVSKEGLENLLTYLIVGMLVGARLAYTLIYNFSEYAANPLEILAVWRGGLSYHGAIAGMAVALLLFSRRYKVSYLQCLDTVACAGAIGVFFGRMGNFINGELYGRATDGPWAMIFPTDPDKLPRHPSQIYQGLTEGVLLFFLLRAIENAGIKNKWLKTGAMTGFYLIGYGVFRFITEFAREPDKQLGFVLGPFSMGQILCFIMILVGAAVVAYIQKTSTLVVLRPLGTDESKPKRKK